MNQKQIGARAPSQDAKISRLYQPAVQMLRNPFVVPIPDDDEMFPLASLSYVHTSVGKSSPQVATMWSEDAAIASNLRPMLLWE